MKKYDIFISYRHDSWESAHLIAAKLQAARYSVFIDNESLHSDVFDVQLYRSIEKCKDFVLVLAPNSLDRCCSENDWMRKEVVRAIECKKNIIPIMLNGFEWPDKMPEDLEILCKYNAAKVQTKTSAFDYEISDIQTRFLKSKPHTNRWHHLVYLLVLGLFMLVSNENFVTKVSGQFIQTNDDAYEYADYTELEKWTQLDSIVTKCYCKDVVSDWYTKRHNAESQYNLGKFCIDIKKYKDALYWMTRYLKNRPDHIAAYNELGRCYYNLVIPQNAKWWRHIDFLSFLNPYYKKKAFECFEKSQYVSTEAMNNLGLCYAKGYGCEPNLSMAAEKYDKAANCNFYKAQFNFASIYLFKGVAKSESDYKYGFNILIKAATNDSIPSAAAQMTLGNIYNENSDPNADFTKYGIAKNKNEAIKWYRMAMGNTDEDIKRKVKPLLDELECADKQ